MSKQSKAETGPAEAEAIPDCPHCHKPLPLCICDSITPIESRISRLIRQPPQTVRMKLHEVEDINQRWVAYCHIQL